jgi:hypothetical protein
MGSAVRCGPSGVAGRAGWMSTERRALVTKQLDVVRTSGFRVIGA